MVQLRRTKDALPAIVGSDPWARFVGTHSMKQVPVISNLEIQVGIRVTVQDDNMQK
jgi:hypothetical protein